MPISPGTYETEVAAFKLHSTALFFDQDISRRKAYCLVSLKNTKFTSDFFKSVIDTWGNRASELIFCVVDTIYVFNEINFYTSISELLAISEKIDSLQKERLRQLQSVIAATPNTRIISWNALVKKTPTSLVEEFRYAYNNSTRFKAMVDKAASGCQAYSALVHHERVLFFLNELPVLTCLYYGNKQIGVIDIYPEENTIFFAELEQGEYRDVLPLASQMADDALPLIYAQTEPRQRNKTPQNCI